MTDHDRPPISPAIQIGENHRRRIRAVLAQIDRALSRWTQDVTSANDTHTLRQLSNDLTETQRHSLGLLVAELRQHLTELQLTLDLPTEVRSLRTSLAAECGLLWESVAGLDPQRLRAWGVTDPQFDAYWEPRRRTLEDLLDRVMMTITEQS